MFTFTRPPQNSIDAAATWIHPKDPAWDKGKICAEIKEMAEAEPPIEESEHPVRRWSECETAFDLDAAMSHPGRGAEGGSVTARDYLDGSQTVFTITPFGTMKEALAYGQSASLSDSVRRAVESNLVKIEVAGEKIELRRDKSGKLDDRTMRMIHHADRDNGHAGLLFHIAGAIARLGFGQTKKP